MTPDTQVATPDGGNAGSRHPVEVEREYVVAQLAHHLAEDSSGIVLDGEEGSGKSTVIRQLAARMPERARVISISTASRWAYDPELVRDEMIQALESLLGALPDNRGGLTDEVALRRLYRNGRTAARRAGQDFVLLLDGLEHIEQADRATYDELVRMCPFGVPGFKIIVTSNGPERPTAIRGVHLKAMGVPPLLLQEIETILAPMSLPADSIAAIHRISRGNPGRVASIWRILRTDPSRRERIADLPRAQVALFELEWELAELTDGTEVAILACLAVSSRPLSSIELARLAETTPSVVDALFERLLFVDRLPDSQWALFNTSIRSRVRALLGDALMLAYDRFIASRLDEPDSTPSLVELPTYFRETGRLKELLDYLSPERSARIFREGTSLSTVRQSAQDGLEAADALQSTAETLRFAFQSSAYEHLLLADTAMEEIRARVAVGDVIGSEAVARAASTLETRCRLLACLARALAENQRIVPEALQSEIELLLSSIDSSMLGDRDIELAADLFAVSPESAVRFLQSSKAGSRDERRSDWGLATLAISTASAGDGSARTGQRFSLADRISDPRARRLALTASLMVSKRSARDVLLETRRIERPTDQLFVLRHWMLANREQGDAVDILEAALSLAMSPSAEVMPATHYRELATCLPHITDLQRRSYFIALLENQLPIVESAGPTHEVARLQILLARAEAIADLPAALSRLENVYLQFGLMKDPMEKVVGLARLQNVLRRLSDTQRTTQSDEIARSCEQDLEATIDQILNLTAEHSEALLPALQAMIEETPAQVTSVLARFNTIARANDARESLVADLARLRLTQSRIEVMRDLCMANTDRTSQARGLLGALEVATSVRKPPAELAALEGLLPCVAALDDASDRVRARALLVLARTRQGLNDSSSQIALREDWTRMRDDWQKLTTGYVVLSVLGSTCGEELKTFAQDVFGLRERLVVSDPDVAAATMFGTRLVLRCFSGLCSLGLISDDHVRRVLSLIGRLEAVEERILLLSEFAMRAQLAGGEPIARQIVDDELIPLLLEERGRDPRSFHHMFVLGAPAVLLLRQNWATMQLADLPDDVVDEALAAAVFCRIRGTAPGDPSGAGRNSRNRLDMVHFAQMIQLVEAMHSDSAIYFALDEITDALARGGQGLVLTRAEKVEVRRLLGDLVGRKLPAMGYLDHEGYRIVAEALLGRLEPLDRGQVRSLLERARRIPNLSDRVYVLSSLAILERGAKRQEIVDEACEEASRIPVAEERISRYSVIADFLEQSDPAMAKRVLERGLSYFVEVEEGLEQSEARRRFFDLAYRIDPRFAQQLIEKADTDPARGQHKREQQRLRAREFLALPKQDERPPSEILTGRLPEAAWHHLGEMNSDAAEPLSAEKAVELMRSAAKLPLISAFPLFSVAVESIVRRDVRNRTGRGLTLPLFEACLRGAELALLVSGRTRSRLPEPVLPTNLTVGGLVVVPTGKPEIGIAVMRTWIETSDADHLVVIDPFFAMADVETLAQIAGGRNLSSISVLCGKLPTMSDLADEVASRWQRYSQGASPIIDIVQCFFKDTEKTPFHDRYLLLPPESGIALGTSLNGLGKRVASVNVLDRQGAAAVYLEHREFIQRTRHFEGGMRVRYVSITSN